MQGWHMANPHLQVQQKRYSFLHNWQTRFLARLPGRFLSALTGEASSFGRFSSIPSSSKRPPVYGHPNHVLEIADNR